MDLIGNLIAGESNEAKIPDLVWAKLEKDNIPTKNKVEAIPQLKENWTHRKDMSTSLYDNLGGVDPALPKESASKKSEKTKEAVEGVIKQAKKEMMIGLKGKELSNKLASLYPPELIVEAKEELIKVAGEQGLLGSVYIDISPFESCCDASRVLGKNKIRLAKYVVGDPSKRVCSTHKNGYCKELNKKVVASIEYSEDLINEYTNHLKMAGKISKEASISSKSELRDALNVIPKKASIPSDYSNEVSEFKTDINKLEKDLISNKAAKETSLEKEAASRRFNKVRPMLAFIQDQMLKGKTGEALKNAVASKYSSKELLEYKEEISKVANLQGLLGNLYVNVSLYKNPEEAILSIKRASTNPVYIVQSEPINEFDNTLSRVASATGCVEFPKDGKVDSKIASSYIDDLLFNNSIAQKTANELKERIAAQDNVLLIIKEAFNASQNYVPEKRVGGVEGSYLTSYAPKYAEDRTPIKENIYKAIEAGIEIDRIEEKLASVLPMGEVVSLVKDVVANANEIDANCLSNCNIDKYQLKSNVSLKEASKCSSCIYKSAYACIHQSAKFSSADKLDDSFLDDKIKKVQLDEIPSEEREDRSQEYKIEDDSGMNEALENM